MDIPLKKEINRIPYPDKFRDFFIYRLIVALFFIFISMVPGIYGQEIISGTVTTKDGTKIYLNNYKIGSDSVIIICPGFYNSLKNRWMIKSVNMIYPVYDVIIFDFRGHGESSGKFTWTLKEDEDLNAILDYAKLNGYRHIGILAFSLGAATSINVAARRNDIESMVLISTPSKFSAIDFHFWEPGMLSDLIDNIDCKWEGKGAKADSIFLKKKDPIDSIGKIKNTSILFIHGDNDWIIKDRHSKKLFSALDTEKKIEIIKGGFHSERLIEQYPQRMQELIMTWFFETMK